jgi:hypothetical protein
MVAWWQGGMVEMVEPWNGGICAAAPRWTWVVRDEGVRLGARQPALSSLFWLACLPWCEAAPPPGGLGCSGVGACVLPAEWSARRPLSLCVRLCWGLLVREALQTPDSSRETIAPPPPEPVYDRSTRGFPHRPQLASVGGKKQ